MALISLKGGQETFPVTDGLNFNSTIVNMFYNNVTNTIQLIDSANAVIANVGSTYLVDALVNQVDFASATYVDYGIGTIVLTPDYAGSGDGGAFVKTDTTNGDFNDWLVLSTENAASTGDTGTTPA